MTNPRWQLAFGLACAGLLAGRAGAQIDRINYRHWAWLEQQRRVLLADLLARPEDRATWDAVAEALTANGEQLPLLTVARAIARARGIEPDAGFLFRSGLQVYALPEVLAKGHRLAVTVHAPFSGLTGRLPQPRKFRFQLRVTDAKGAVVHEAEIPESEEFRDLREFRSVRELELTHLPEGAYTVHVDTILDGVAPRSTDLPLQVPIGIDYDYDKRAGTFRLIPGNAAIVAAIQAAAPLPRAVLQGAAEYASRAWFGTPGVTPSHARRELAVAETVLRNVTAKEFPLRGIGGPVTVALPAFAPDDAVKQVVFVHLRLPPDGLPAKDSPAWRALAARPLVLVMPGVPMLDHDDRRPSFPPYALPSFAAEALRVAGFDAAGAFQLAVVESPGRVGNTRQALDAVLRELPGVVPFDAQRLVLVGEGHGGNGMADLAQRKVEAVRGLVLVNSTGGLASPQLRVLRAVPILVVPGHGRLSADQLARLRTYAGHAEHPAVEIRDQRKWPWSIALPLASNVVEDFVRRVSKR